jgi:hypothetical protein
MNAEHHLKFDHGAMSLDAPSPTIGRYQRAGYDYRPWRMRACAQQT